MTPELTWQPPGRRKRGRPKDTWRRKKTVLLEEFGEAAQAHPMQHLAQQGGDDDDGDDRKHELDKQEKTQLMIMI